MLANVISKVISMSLAFGPVTRLITKIMYANLYANLNAQESWCQVLLNFQKTPNIVYFQLSLRQEAVPKATLPSYMSRTESYKDSKYCLFKMVMESG